MRFIHAHTSILKESKGNKKISNKKICNAQLNESTKDIKDKYVCIALERMNQSNTLQNIQRIQTIMNM